MSFKSWLRNRLLGPGREEPPFSLDVAIRRYEASLDSLGDGADIAVLLSVLVQRDQVATALAKKTATPTMVQHLTGLDHRLRRVAREVTNVDWDAWRKACNPSPDRWWWRLDEVHAQAEKKRDFPLGCLAGLLMAIALSLAADIIQRVWSGGPDSLSVVGTILTLIIAGSPLTKQSRELAGWLMDNVRLPRRFRGEAMLGAAFPVCLVIVILHLALPAFAVYTESNLKILTSLAGSPG